MSSIMLPSIRAYDILSGIFGNYETCEEILPSMNAIRIIIVLEQVHATIAATIRHGELDLAGTNSSNTRRGAFQVQLGESRPCWFIISICKSDLIRRSGCCRRQGKWHLSTQVILLLVKPDLTTFNRYSVGTIGNVHVKVAGGEILRNGHNTKTKANIFAKM